MDVKKINTIIELFKNADIDELALELKDFKITLKNQKATNVIQHVSTIEKKDVQIEKQLPVEKQEVKGEWIKAPFVGTFYASSKEDAPAFVSVGQTVQKGDVLFILEAMKVMNEIKADKPGKVLEIKVNNGDLVEFDQALILIGD